MRRKSGLKAVLSSDLLKTMLNSVLTSLESGFAIPVAEGPKNHNSACRYLDIFIIVTQHTIMTSINNSFMTSIDFIVVNYLRTAH